MLIAQMDAAVTPLAPMSGDTSELERALDPIKATDARADFPRALRFATDSAARPGECRRSSSSSDGAPRRRRRRRRQVQIPSDVKLTYRARRRDRRQSRNVGITAFSVRRYPLDKSRYEVMLEVTNTGPEQEDVELSLLGDGNLVDLTKLRLKPGERLPRFYPNLSGASRTLEAKITPLPGSQDVAARRRSRVRAPARAAPREGARRLAGQHVPRGRAAPRRVPRRAGGLAGGVRREDRAQRRQARRHSSSTARRPRRRRAATRSTWIRADPARP